MGLFDSADHLTPRSSSYHGGSGNHSRGASPARSGGAFVRPSASSHNSHYARSASNGSSFFGSSSRGIFSGGGGSGSSYYKRRPRDGYIAYLLHRLQRMIKELWVYARRHPVKAFFAVVVPLLSAGGAVAGLLKQFGIRLPMGLGGLMEGGARRGGGGYYGSEGYGGGGGGGGGGMGGLMGGAGQLLSVAKMFM